MMALFPFSRQLEITMPPCPSTDRSTRILSRFVQSWKPSTAPSITVWLPAARTVGRSQLTFQFTTPAFPFSDRGNTEIAAFGRSWNSGTLQR